jgi:hypothetical protein
VIGNLMDNVDVEYLDLGIPYMFDRLKNGAISNSAREMRTRTFNTMPDRRTSSS